MTGMRPRIAWLMVLVVLAGLLAACGGDDDEGASAGGGDQAEEGPIVIGAAIDQTKLMQFFDGPAIAAAQLRAAEINANGGVNGRKIEFRVQDTRLDPERTRAAALELIEGGADILWVTCDVDWATPSTQVGIAEGKLTVAPCIGTDQMGPKRFGDEGKLAFSFGNVAQDEGAALAQLAVDQGFKTVNVVTDKSIVYTQNVCAAFTNRFQELGGQVAAQESFTEGDGTIGRVVSSVDDSEADANAICATTQEDLPTFVSGVRGLGNDTPIIGPWSIDGAFWLPKSDRVADNIMLVTYASVYGDDPNQEVRSLIEQMTADDTPPATGGFVAGAAAVDGIVAAIEKTGGSTEGEALAGALEGMQGLETISGAISFSPEFHTVFGREYRIIEIQDGKPAFVDMIKAESPADL
jgi:branched-chain amino acid transport system substrate-binding protein